jgi:hypothetical protein
MRNSLLIASRGFVPLPLRAIILALQGVFREEEPQPLIFGSTGGTGRVPLRKPARIKPRLAWRPPMPIIARQPVEDDEGLILCGAI